MTTFSPDDPSIWHYRRKEGEELPPELVAARRESLRRRRPQPDPPPQPATVSETSRGWPVSTPYVPRPETPAEQYVYEYREYLRTRPDWTEGQVSPYVVEPRNPPPSEDRSLFANQWSFLSPEQEAAMERERDSAVTRQPLPSRRSSTRRPIGPVAPNSKARGVGETESCMGGL